MTALPAAVVALSSEGHAQQVSALIALGWFSLVPIALYERWVALALPVVAAAFLVLTLVFLPASYVAVNRIRPTVEPTAPPGAVNAPGFDLVLMRR